MLRELARRVKECVREVDTVARYGGEEFALLLPETDLDGAERLGGRVLASIRSERFRLPDGTQLAITASMGVAGVPPPRRHRDRGHARGRRGAVPGQVRRARPRRGGPARRGGHRRPPRPGRGPVSALRTRDLAP